MAVVTNDRQAAMADALSAQVADAAEWHNKADEPVAVDYNTDGKPQDKYTDAPYRASDHDPVLLSLNLAGAPADVTASVRIANSGLAFARASGKWTGTLSITNTAATALTGRARRDGTLATSTVSDTSVSCSTARGAACVTSSA
jgi:hypothetical protein